MRTLFAFFVVAACLAAGSTSAFAQAHFTRGDSNRDQKVDVSDGINTLNFLFLGTGIMPCLEAGDFDDDGDVNIGDPVNTFTWLFLGGSPPAAPYPVFEGDPTPDSLGCIVTPTNPIIDITTDITVDTHWTSDHVYRIVSLIFVRPPAVLTIDAGTTIFGSSTSTPLGVLTVTKGAKIIAVGEENFPVVFTSEKPVGQRAKQNWGGLIILGDANNNIVGKTAGVEGILDPITGGNIPFGPGAEAPDDSDNSGRLSYVRIEWGGYALSLNNEVNGLGLYSVGRGTQLDHIQVRYIGDDAVEWFGGNVDLKYAVEVGTQDDMFDTSFGASNRGQFLVGLQDGDGAESGGNGLEMCNSESPTGNYVVDLPLSKPTYSNITLCGPGTPNPTTGGAHGANGMLLRRKTGAGIYNFILQGFRSYGVNIDDPETTQNIDPGILVVDYGILYKNGLNTNASGDGWCQVGQTGAAEETPANGFLYTSCGFLAKMTHLLYAVSPPTVNAFDLANPDWRPQNDAAVASPFDPVTLNGSDSFFTSAPYYGAIAPGTEPKDDWTHKPWMSYLRN